MAIPLGTQLNSQDNLSCFSHAFSHNARELLQNLRSAGTELYKIQEPTQH